MVTVSVTIVLFLLTVMNLNVFYLKEFLIISTSYYLNINLKHVKDLINLEIRRGGWR